MRIRIRDTGQVMYESEYRREFAHLLPPPTLTEAWINGAGGDVVFEGPAATGGTVYQHSQYDGVEQKEDGKWYTKYILGPVFTDTTDEDGTVTSAADNQAAYEARMDAKQAEIQRAERDKKLAACDWTQLADSPLTDEQKTAWGTYRQALRDVPAQAGFPWEVTWPSEPE
jgi:hypothetical protein